MYLKIDSISVQNPSFNCSLSVGYGQQVVTAPKAIMTLTKLSYVALTSAVAITTTGNSADNAAHDATANQGWVQACTGAATNQIWLNYWFRNTNASQTKQAAVKVFLSAEIQGK
jgi:hypothetical protein